MDVQSIGSLFPSWNNDKKLPNTFGSSYWRQAFVTSCYMNTVAALTTFSTAALACGLFSAVSALAPVPTATQLFVGKAVCAGVAIQHTDRVVDTAASAIKTSVSALKNATSATWNAGRELAVMTFADPEVKTDEMEDYIGVSHVEPKAGYLSSLWNGMSPIIDSLSHVDYL